MSIGELLIILLVMILVIKPSDWPIIFKKINSFKNSALKFKKELLSNLDPTTDDAFSSQEEINFYLEKIFKAGGVYEGDYDLEKIKKTYDDLQKKLLNK